MNIPINIENLGDLTPKEHDEAIFMLGAEYGARAMAERSLQIIEATRPCINIKADVETQMIERMVDRLAIRDEILKIIGGNA